MPGMAVMNVSTSDRSPEELFRSLNRRKNLAVRNTVTNPAPPAPEMRTNISRTPRAVTVKSRRFHPLSTYVLHDMAAMFTPVSKTYSTQNTMESCSMI